MRDNHPGVRPGWLSREYRLVGALTQADCGVNRWYRCDQVVQVNRRYSVTGFVVLCVSKIMLDEQRTCFAGLFTVPLTYPSHAMEWVQKVQQKT